MSTKSGQLQPFALLSQIFSHQAAAVGRQAVPDKDYFPAMELSAQLGNKIYKLYRVIAVGNNAEE